MQNLFTRGDTLFGVCEAIGQDLGFNPIVLRVAFALSLLVNAVVGIGAYLVLGVVVLASRLIFPARRRAKPVAAEAVTGAGDNDAETIRFAEAA